jgi:hypothetical protein
VFRGDKKNRYCKIGDVPCINMGSVLFPDKSETLFYVVTIIPLYFHERLQFIKPQNIKEDYS